MPILLMIPDFDKDLNGNVLSFDGNTALKSYNQPLAYTEAHVVEFLKCKESYEYFAENYYYILSLDEGMIKVKLRDYQKNMIDSFKDNRFSIVLASRQCGKSTSYEVFLLWYILFNESKNVAILANKAETAKGILRKIKLAYELLPHWLQQGVKSWNASSIELENGCTIIASATSSSAIRSKSINILILDEFAFISQSVFDQFYSAVYPTISSSQESKIIMVSTPFGLNHYYKFWNDALNKRNAFNHLRVDWWEVPGRDDKWKEETIRNIGERRFACEYGNDFLGSSFTLVEGKYLATLTEKEQTKIPMYLDVTLNDFFKAHLKIYEEVDPKRTYAMGVDTSKMSEESVSDPISMHVLDVTELPFKQVATCIIRDGISYLELPELINHVGKYYNEAYLFIENNEGSGQVIANTLAFEYEYENIYREKNGIPGYRTTAKTKRLGCSNLKALIEHGRLMINDFDTICQLSTFTKHGSTFRADKGYFDDAVMSLIGSIFFMIDKNVLEMSEVDFVKGIMNRNIEDAKENEPIIIDLDETPALDWSWLYN